MQTLETDVAVLGSGIAGLTAALTARQNGCQVLIVSDARCRSASSRSGGVFRGPTRDYAPEQHFLDTVSTGKYLPQRSLVKALAQDASAVRSFIEGLGVSVEETPTGFRVAGDQNLRGATLTAGLEAACEVAQVKRLSAFAWEIILGSGETTCGVLAFDTVRSEWLAIAARAVIIATGGAAGIYARAGSSPDATGDGLAMAFRAGAALADMEFVQFWPLATLETEACVPLMPGDLAGRRLIAGERDVTDRVGLSGLVAGEGTLSLVGRRIYEEGLLASAEEELPLRLTGADPGRAKPNGSEDSGSEPTPVTPAAHYTLGGVVGGDHGQTRISGLYVAGEAAAGMHGADRLSGNGLTEACVMGRRAGVLAAASVQSAASAGVGGDWDRLVREYIRRTVSLLEGVGDGTLTPTEATRRIRQAMWRSAALVRTRESLDAAQSTINRVKRVLPLNVDLDRGDDIRTALKACNLILVAEAVARSARYRRESRGFHFRTDYPGSDDAEWLRHVKVRLLSGEMSLDISQGLEIMEP
jgi:succinate dehydrogenase/fumarate reductase flavoprotein subunit